MKTMMTILVACLISTAAEARFDCGRVQARHFGVGSARALDWARDFQHVSAQVGAVVVQTRRGRALGGGQGGHVSRIVAHTPGSCTATVTDDRGTYQRDICKNLVAYVLPGAGSRMASHEPRRSRHSERRSRPRERIQYAGYTPADRFAPK